jgi:hypothetical protein
MCISNPIKSYSKEILLWCVPCFIILWAYFFEKSYIRAVTVKEKKEYIRKRFISLFKFYLVYSTFYFFLSVNWSTITFVKVFTMFYMGNGFTGQYFFIILLQLSLLYPIIKYFYSKNILLIFSGAIIVIMYSIYTFYFDSLPILLRKLGDNPFFLWLPYVYIGIGLAHNKIVKIPSVFILSIFLVPVEWYVFSVYNLSHSGYITPVVLISSSLFCIGLLQLNLRIKNVFILKAINFFGQNSLLFFVTNPFVAYVIASNLKIKQHFLGLKIFNVLDPIISFLLVLFICTGLALMIKKTRLKGVLY